MRNPTVRIVVLMTVALLTLSPGTALAAAPAPGTPEWYLAELDNTVAAEGRGMDQTTNPDYVSRFLPDALGYLAGSDTRSVLIDPFRKDWDGTRGRMIDIEYRNRYGAKIHGTLFAPLHARGRLPAVVSVPGLGSDRRVR